MAIILQGPGQFDSVPDLSLGNYLLEHLRIHQNELAQVYPLSGTKITFRDIERRAITMSLHFQKMGLQEGETVVVFANPCPEFPVIMCAVLFTNCAFVPLNPAMRGDELKEVLQKLQPSILIADDEMRHVIMMLKAEVLRTAQLLPLEVPASSLETDYDAFMVGKPGDTDWLRTGTIILCCHRAEIVCLAVQSQGNWMSLLHVFSTSNKSWNKNDVWLQHTHVSDFSGIFLQFLNIVLGNKMIVLPKFDSNTVLQVITDYEVSFLVSNSSSLCALSQTQQMLSKDVSKLRQIACICSGMIHDLQSNVEVTMDAKVHLWYAKPETLVISCSNSSSPAGSVGRPLPNVLVKIVSLQDGSNLAANFQGELLVKSPWNFLCYLHDSLSSSTIHDFEGWLRTGDMALYDVNNNIYVLSRICDFINYQGNSISPIEIERLLLSHAGVREVVVVGARCSHSGDLATAFVVKNQHVPVTEMDLMKLVEENLPPSKWLTGGVYFVAQLPKFYSGEVMRRELRNMATVEYDKKSHGV